MVIEPEGARSLRVLIQYTKSFFWLPGLGLFYIRKSGCLNSFKEAKPSQAILSFILHFKLSLSLFFFKIGTCLVYLALCSLLDYSCSGSSIHGILRARILERVAIFSSRGRSQLRDRTHFSCFSCIGRRILYHCTTSDALKICRACKMQWKEEELRKSFFD